MVVMDNVSTKKTNAVAINVMRTVSINCHSKKYEIVIFCTVLLAIMLLLIIIIICSHYVKQKGTL